MMLPYPNTNLEQEEVELPIYNFQCYSCGLQFEEMLRVSQRDKEVSCPSCGEKVERQVSAGNFTFKHNPTGPVPQDTGVSSIDHNYDRVIGRDAEQKWKRLEEKRSRKLAFIERERRQGRDVRMEHLTSDSEGGYRTLTEKEIKKVNTDREIVQNYNHSLKKDSKPK